MGAGRKGVEGADYSSSQPSRSWNGGIHRHDTRGSREKRLMAECGRGRGPDRAPASPRERALGRHESNPGHQHPQGRLTGEQYLPGQPGKNPGRAPTQTGEERTERSLLFPPTLPAKPVSARSGSRRGGNMSHPGVWLQGVREGGWDSHRALRAARNLESGIAAWRYRSPVLWHQCRSSPWTKGRGWAVARRAGRRRPE